LYLRDLRTGQASYIFLGLSFLCLKLEDWITVGFFNLSIIDIWGWIVLGCGELSRALWDVKQHLVSTL